MPYGDFGEHRQPHMPRPGKWYLLFVAACFAVVLIVKVLSKVL